MDSIKHKAPETVLTEAERAECVAVAGAFAKIGTAIRDAKTVGDLIAVEKLVEGLDETIDSFM